MFLWFNYKWLNSMVYGIYIYITIVNGAYKATQNWGAPSCNGKSRISSVGKLPMENHHCFIGNSTINGDSSIAM